MDAQRLPIRLTREPSLAAELRRAIVYACVPMVLVSLGAWAWWTNPAKVPDWARYAAPVMVLFTLGFLWSVAVKARRAASGIEPIVEVDSQPWLPGASVQVRIAVSDAASFVGLEAVLIAEDIKVERVGAASRRRSGVRYSEVVRHEAPLLTVREDALKGSDPLDRVLTAVAPAEAARNNSWRWQIVVRASKARGVPREDRYPIRIGTG